MANDRVVCSYPRDISMSDDIFTRLMAERGISFPEAVEIVSEMDGPLETVELTKKWLLRELIEDGQATSEIKTFLQDFARRRGLDLTRN